MDVIGGAYLEAVDFYGYKNLFGSSTRAAAAVAGMIDVRLTTCLGKDQIETLEVHSESYGFEFKVQEILGRTIGFRYFHGLSDGQVCSLPSSNDDKVTLRLEDSAALLRFGMVEGTAIVSGDRVVYDPQSPTSDFFHDNGSKANELALVLNATEARSWTDKNDIKSAGKCLLDRPDVRVVVIKDGPRGALVFDKQKICEIPAYRTERVWPVGSGDVFSGMFTYYWAVEQSSPEEAAQRASLAAAYFCETRVLPIPSSPQERDEFNGVAIEGYEAPRIYLAGPFFNLGQRWLVEEARRLLLDHEMDVFSPIHDVGEAKRDTSMKEIARADLEGILSCDVVLALLDDADRGTHFEIGFARENEIPVIAYADHLEVRDRTMLEGTDCKIFSHFPTAIYHAVWENRN